MLMIATFLGCMIAAAACWYLLPYAIRKLAEIRLARRCRGMKAIVLSYDDGPAPGLTPRLLDMLRGRAQATFFILGNRAAENHDMVPRLLADGHEVGSHSQDHVNAWKAGPGRALRDVARGIETVRDLGGDGTLFRPPHGKMTLATFVDSLRRGQRLGWWTIDTKDTKEDGGGRKSPDQVLAEIAAQGGGVVLMHDFDRVDGPAGETDSHADYVLNLTGRILEFADTQGYRLVRLGDVTGAAPGPTLREAQA